MSNLIFDNLHSCVETIEKAQTAVSAKLTLKDSLSQVLSLGVNTLITGYTCEENSATFKGKTTFKVIYRNEEHKVRSSVFSSEFSDKIVSPLITPTSLLRFDVETVDKHFTVEENTIDVNILLETKCFVTKTYEQQVLSPCKDICVRETEVEICDEITTWNQDFTLSFETELKNKADSVLLAESNLCVKSFVFEQDVLKVDGIAYVTTLYSKEGFLHSETQSFDFSEEFDCKRFSDSQVNVSLNVKNTKMKLEMDDDESFAGAYVEIYATMFATKYAVSSRNVISDAYSCSNELIPTFEFVETTLLCGFAQRELKIEQSIPVETSGVCCVANARAVVTNVRTTQSTVTLEGVLSGDALIQNEFVQSESFELPFVFDVGVDFVGDNCVATATAFVTEIKATAHGALNVSASICVEISAFEKQRMKVICSAEQTPLNKQDVSAIEIILAKKGETLWNIAKSLSMTEDEIIQLNPDLCSPLEKDTRILLYHKL